MTTHTDRARELLPCTCGKDDHWDRAGHYATCPAYYRPAIAQALADAAGKWEQLVAQLPKHEGELILTHNPHKSNYETVEELEVSNWPGKDAWVSEEQRTKAKALQDVWVLQWYPDTPVGFYVIMAADLGALIDAANSTEGTKT